LAPNGQNIGLTRVKITLYLPSLTVRRTGDRTHSVRRCYGGAIGAEPGKKNEVHPGEFLFNPDTVKRAVDFYQLVRELPYLRPLPTESLARTEQLITGWMIPLAWWEAVLKS